jgi:hypothetical protein
LPLPDHDDHQGNDEQAADGDEIRKGHEDSDGDRASYLALR